MDWMAVIDRAWPLLGRVVDGHIALYRATGGRIGGRLRGAPVLLLEHVGARTGRSRTTALLYVADGSDLVVVASKGGHPRHPAWFHNLAAKADVMVQVGPARRPVRARVASPRERERLWPMLLDTYAGYASYQERTEREIPLVVLERRGSD